MKKFNRPTVEKSSAGRFLLGKRGEKALRFLRFFDLFTLQFKENMI